MPPSVDLVTGHDHELLQRQDERDCGSTSSLRFAPTGCDAGDVSTTPTHIKEIGTTRRWHGYLAELCEVTTLALPAAASNLLNNLMGTVDLIMIGHLGAEALAAGALANLWVFGTCIVGYGLSTAMDTLCSQAYGARNYVMFSESTQHAAVMLTMYLVPICLLFWFSEPFMIALGQDAGVAAAASEYVRWIIPGLWPWLQTCVVTKFLSSQGVMKPPVYAAVLSNVLNAAFNYVLIRGVGTWPGLGFKGAPIATTCSRFCNFTLLLGYVLWFGVHKKVWTGWSRAALQAAPLWAFLKLGVPGAVMICVEVWLFVVCAIFSGMLGTLELAANEALFNMCSIPFTVCIGVSVAATVRVGNSLGAAEPATARRAARVCIVLSTAFMLVAACVYLTARRFLGLLYTQDEAVVRLMATVFPIMAAFSLFDGLGVACAGCLRGMGQQRVGAWCNTLGMWALGVPLAVALAFPVGLGIYGVWWGLFTGIVTASSAQCLCVLGRTDWDLEAQRAVERTRNEKDNRDNVGVGVDIEAGMELENDGVELLSVS